MADQPKSTADILAAIRKKGASEGDAPPPAPPAEAPAPASETPSPAPAAPATAAPKGTSDILASIRAKGGGDAASGAAPAQPAAAAPAEAPKSSGDILAAIRAKGAGGAAAAKPAGDKPAAAPKSSSDIMAAIRGGGAAAPAVASKPAAAKAAAPAKPAGEKPSVQEMLKAVRAGQPMPAPGAPKAPPRLPAGKPASAKAAIPPKPRRNVLAPILALVASPFALAWSLMTLITGVWTLKGAQFMMPNMILELPSRFKVGVTSDYPLGTVSEKFKASRGIWIVHTDQYDGSNLIYALASVCTHLGCTPNWLEGEQKFKCPCHGSGFYINGVNFEGPAPRPLERVGIRVAEDGQLEVDKSVKFQEELGQWADVKSFVELV